MNEKMALRGKYGGLAALLKYLNNTILKIEVFMTTLRQLREQNKKKPIEVASILNVSLQTVYRYEQGMRRISLEQVLILAELYDCTAEEIIEAQINSCRCDRAGSRH